LLAGELSRFGIETAWVNGSDTEAIRRALEPGARLLLVEAIGNPLMQVPDLPRLAALCRDAGALLVVDATFASPYCCRPLQHGAGVVLHSVTKFLAGHSDVTLGVAAGSAAVATELRRQARLFGGSANPFESWLALRGLTTFPLRMGRCCANAAELARRLAAHPKVRAVHYPGLAGSGRSAAPKGVLTDPGAMLSFELEGGDAARAFLRCLQYVRFAPSLGDVATTVSYPIATSHRGLPCGTLGELGISAGLVRLSAGIDHVDDVWSDLEQALAASG
jgi:methionine-gamma-lyase